MAAAQKGVATDIKNNGLSLDLEPFSVQLTRLDNMDHLILTIAKELKKSLPFVRFRGKPFGKESVLTTLVSKKFVAMLVDSISTDSVKGKNNNSTNKIHNNITNNEEVSFCKQVDSNAILSPIITIISD